MTRGVSKGKVTCKELKEKLGLPNNSKLLLVPLLQQALERTLITQEQFEASLPTTVSTIKCYLYSIVKDPDDRNKLEEYVAIASKLYIRGSYIANLHAYNKYGDPPFVEQDSYRKVDQFVLEEIDYNIYDFVEEENLFKQVFLPERWPSSKQQRCLNIQGVLNQYGDQLQHLYTDNWETFMKTSGWDNSLNNMYTKYRANIENHIKVHIFKYIKHYIDKVTLRDEVQRPLIVSLFNQEVRPYTVHNDDFEWIMSFRELLGQRAFQKKMFKIGDYNNLTTKLWIWFVKNGVAKTTYLPLMSMNRKYCYIDTQVAKYLLPKKYKTLKTSLGRDPTIQDMFNVTSQAFKRTRNELRRSLRRKYKKENNKKLKKKWFNSGHSNIPRNAIVKVIETDGVGASIIIHRPINPQEEVKSPITDADNIGRLEDPMMVGIDGGRAKILAAAICTNSLTKPETLIFSRKQYYKEIKHKVRMKWENNRVQSNPQLKVALTDLSEDNGTLNVVVYIRKVNTHHQVLHDEYIIDKERALWKMRLYRFKKRSIDLAIRRILVKAKDRPIVIGIGSASFPSTGKGEKAVPTTSLMKAFIKAHYRHHKRIVLLKVDEFRTTLCCCACGNVTEAKVKVDGKRSARLRSCTKCDETIDKVRDRDVQAARNMLWLTQYMYHGAERPFYMCRGYRQDVS